MPNEVPERFRVIVAARAMGHCERCGTCLPGGGGEVHHREPRALHNHSPSYLVYPCPGCHRWVHTHPEQAREDGWVISRHDTRPAAEIPLLHWMYGWVLLDDQGGFTLTERTADATER